MDAFAAWALRCVAGYLLQMVPCAVLCLAPFWNRLKLPRRRAVGLVVAALASSCAVFSIVGAMPLGAWEQWRIFILNLVFMALLVPFLALFWHLVDAGRACKTFVFLQTMAFGSLVVMVQGALYAPLGIPSVTDGHMYPLAKLAVLAAVSACAFPPAVLAMRWVAAPQVDADAFGGRWWGLCLIPGVILLLLVVGNWLPDAYGLPDDQRLPLFAAVSVAAAAVLCVYHMASSRKAAFAQSERDALSRATSQLRREREELESHVRELDLQRDQLASRVGELEREKRTAAEHLRRGELGTRDAADAGKVVLKAPGAVVSFYPREALYLEVLDHTLTVHLANGSAERIAYGLAKARELLPGDRFIQCHRSYLVNRDAVRSLRRYEAELVDGSRIPVSKQRYHEMEQALG